MHIFFVSKLLNVEITLTSKIEFNAKLLNSCNVFVFGIITKIFRKNLLKPGLSELRSFLRLFYLLSYVQKLKMVLELKMFIEIQELDTYTVFSEVEEDPGYPDHFLNNLRNTNKRSPL